MPTCTCTCTCIIICILKVSMNELQVNHLCQYMYTCTCMFHVTRRLLHVHEVCHSCANLHVVHGIALQECTVWEICVCSVYTHVPSSSIKLAVYLNIHYAVHVIGLTIIIIVMDAIMHDTIHILKRTLGWQLASSSMTDCTMHTCSSFSICMR